MTEQEIKQNAEVYANTIRIGGLSNSPKLIARVSFEEGAHSRDEEIAYLTYRLNDTTEKLQTVIAERDNLYNPWISVEDGLPERHTPVYAKNNNKSWFFALMTDNKQRPWYNIVGRCGEKVTHWKPIHELEKEE